MCPRSRKELRIPSVTDLAIWMICAVAVAGVLARPFGIPEWAWAVGAALVITAAGLLPLPAIARAISAGTDVYLFLAGMMLLAELARRDGVFDWIATHAVRASGTSCRRLFALVYGVGTIVTIVLSNDATAVVLTPAVAAAVRAARVQPRPYLFACALIANAASFVLPISNPANLVVFARGMPALVPWLAAFALPSLCAIAITYVVLLLLFRRDLAEAIADEPRAIGLGRSGVVTLAGIGLTALALIAASTFGRSLGVVTFVAGLCVFVVATLIDRRTALPVVRSVSWSVLLLVAGLFVLVSAVERTGLLRWTQLAARIASTWPEPYAYAAAAFATALVSNLINNLPSGLIAGSTIAGTHVSAGFRSAVAIGIDLGPNLSVTGSLATVLWLLALRREKIDVDAWRFFRIGLIVMPLSLLAAVESVRVFLH